MLRIKAGLNTRFVQQDCDISRKTEPVSSYEVTPDAATYLHHDGYSQRAFSYVFFAFLARRFAAFGIFRPVQLVVLRICHVFTIKAKSLKWL